MVSLALTLYSRLDFNPLGTDTDSEFPTRLPEVAPKYFITWSFDLEVTLKIITLKQAV